MTFPKEGVNILDPTPASLPLSSVNPLQALCEGRDRPKWHGDESGNWIKESEIIALSLHWAKVLTRVLTAAPKIFVTKAIDRTLFRNAPLE